MPEKYDQFIEYLHEINDLIYSLSLLGWDHQVNMPPGGAQARGNAMATLGKILHDRSTSEQAGELLESAESYVKNMDPDSDEACMVKVVKRAYEKHKKIPTEWVGENLRETAIGQSIWERAKAQSNFKLFEAQLTKIVDLARQYAGFFKPYDHIYDPLLDDYEHGMKTVEVQQIFNTLRPKQVQLIKELGGKPQVDDSFLHISYPEQFQWDFGIEVLKKFGFDFKRGRQDKSVHPFTQGLNIGDVRITTRFDPERAASALFSTMHECGHALYEQGYDPRFDRTPLSGPSSAAVHESQSRMWENLVGRSLPFWKYFYKTFQGFFPSQVGNLDLMTFYKGINKVEPSLIRVEADEATYNLHIMLRMELEIALIEGSLQVKDLPEAWNSRIKAYLGLTPPNDAQGVLQDVHWSSGMFGYFPSYALGNLISVQLWEKIHQDIPNLEAQIEKGEFAALLDWLRKNVHSQGAKFDPQELVMKVTGSKIDPAPYLKYLETKYKSVYFA